ncbi:hypothetical protein A3732_12645 [Oleiphilus sp. HI0050]|nr:hypothetical protein A3732_12645 [Oleiphilus sp. HI0050]
MKSIVAKLLSVVTLCCAVTQLNAAPQSAGEVERIYVNSGGLVLFRLGKAVDLPADCSDVNWPYEFSVDDKSAKEWYALLLAAKAQGQSVRIGYYAQEGKTRCKVAYLYQ